MTISILVCDDLPEERANLIRKIRAYEKTHDAEFEIETASDGAELIAKWQPDRWKIIFLDIYMPHLNGIEAARQLRKVDTRCEIVFVTTSRDHGMDGYELKAMDYLTKPYSQQDVDGAMDWYLRKQSEKRRELTVRTSDGNEELLQKDICFIESRGHTCDIHVHGRVVCVRRSIDELAAELNASFFRCHKSFLINIAHASGIDGNRFRMDSGDSVPISAAKLSESKSTLLAWRAEMHERM